MRSFLTSPPRSSHRLLSSLIHLSRTPTRIYNSATLHIVRRAMKVQSLDYPNPMDYHMPVAIRRTVGHAYLKLKTASSQNSLSRVSMRSLTYLLAHQRAWLLAWNSSRQLVPPFVREAYLAQRNTPSGQTPRLDLKRLSLTTPYHRTSSPSKRPSSP